MLSTHCLDIPEIHLVCFHAQLATGIYHLLHVYMSEKKQRNHLWQAQTICAWQPQSAILGPADQLWWGTICGVTVHSTTHLMQNVKVMFI